MGAASLLPQAGAGILGQLHVRGRGPHDLARTGRSTSAARFVVNVAESVVAPTNTFLGNPAAVKRAYETGGLSLLRGTRNLLDDVVHNGGMPSTVDRSVYQVGRDFAITPGTVVDRDPYAELIQYTPSTKKVQTRPVLIIPPPIGRYYFLDLRPGRSMVEYTVSRGLQAFMLSWRTPRANRQAGTSTPTPGGWCRPSRRSARSPGPRTST